jgi:hypothetical protein
MITSKMARGFRFWVMADVIVLIRNSHSKCSDYRRAQADEQEVTRWSTATFAPSEQRGPLKKAPFILLGKAPNALAFGDA